MLSSTARRQLMQQMYHEPVYPWIVIGKCVSGLAIVILLAVIADIGDGRNSAQPTSAAAAAAQR